MVVVFILKLNSAFVVFRGGLGYADFYLGFKG
jgi:hypothetical protein